MDVLIIIYLFLIGASFGSFALVLVDRLHAKRNWVSERSCCEHCGHTLGVRDLVPLASWLAQRGRCRYCKKNISRSYPLTELFTATTFAISYVLLPYELDSAAAWIMLISWLAALVLMTALLVFDLRWKLLPTKLIRPLYLLGIIHAAAFYNVQDDSLLRYGATILASIVVAAGVFAVLFVLSQGRWIGDGDIRFGVVMGLFLADPLLAWASLFVASIVGLLYAVPQLAKSKKKMQLKIPFGPFLIIGLIVTYLIGGSVVDWYIDEFLYL